MVATPAPESAARLLASATQARIDRRAADLADLQTLLAWSELHLCGDNAAAESTTSTHSSPEQDRGGERSVRIGGDGTPLVREFAVVDMALARQTSPAKTRADMAAVLDLTCRLPRTWAAVESLKIDAWVAVKIARTTRELSLRAAGQVDDRIAPYLGSESPGRILAAVEAAVAEADPARAEREYQATLAHHRVTIGRTNDAGLRTVLAKLDAGDAAWVDATITRLTQHLTTRHPEESQDRIRARAFAMLARPAEALQLLLADDDGVAITETSRATALPADLVPALATTPIASSATVYVHLHADTLFGHTPGLARVEGLGPMLLTQLREFLSHSRVTLQPVIDLADKVTVNAYEHPARISERTWLTYTADAYPYAAGRDRSRLDYDHATPYQSTGPPGQTGTHNSQPLTRRHHRYKTHAGLRTRPTGPGRVLWKTRHHHYLRDHTGTHPLPPHQGHTIWQAPPGTHIHFGHPIQLDDYTPMRRDRS